MRLPVGIPRIVKLTALSASLAVFGGLAPAQGGDVLGTRSAIQYEYEEWSVPVAGLSGNPFDVSADAVLTGSDGSSTVTPMYYAGTDNQSRRIYAFRFTGTAPGMTYAIETQSSVGALDGLTGTVSVSANPDPEAIGFVQSVGSKFAVERGPAGELSGFLMNIMQTDPAGDESPFKHLHLTDLADNPVSDTREYVEYAAARGFTAVYVLLTNNLSELGTFEGAQVGSSDPDLAAFDALDQIIETAHEHGVHVHFWRWGDAGRDWTPQNLPGGINGSADRRITRYLAARLGPLPSWSIGYGFDLHEWVSPSQLESWRSLLVGELGFPHLVSARSYGFNAPVSAMIGYAQGDEELGEDTARVPTYSQMVSLINANPDQPHLLEERNVLDRWGLDSDDTRLLMWRSAMAGGVGGWYGFFGKNPVFTSDNGYSNDAALATHGEFWRDRFLLDTEPANGLTSGPNQQQYAVRSAATGSVVVFAEDTDRVDLNLSGLAGPLTAVAVDTRQAYAEQPLGSLPETDQVWDAPYRSDWAIAITSGEACAGDLTGDGIVNSVDFFAWVQAFQVGNPAADINADGSIDGSDFFAWVDAYTNGC